MDTLTSGHAAIKADRTPLNGFLPAESPLEMSIQPLRDKAGPFHAARFASMWPRRAVILAGTAILTAAACYEMYEVLQVGGVTILEGIVLALYVMLFAWVAFSFTSSVAGFFVLLLRARDALGIDPGTVLPPIRGRTAMLLPTYNEDPARVFARLRAIYESVEDTGSASHFDWFVLSDTTDPGIWITEEKCFLRVRADLSGHQSLLPSPRPEYCAEVWQYRGLGQAVRGQL